MRRVDNFLRTTHWIAECKIYTMDKWGLNSAFYIGQEFDSDLSSVRSADEWSIGNEIMWWTQWWIDRVDTSNGILVPCNGGTF